MACHEIKGDKIRGESLKISFFVLDDQNEIRAVRMDVANGINGGAEPGGDQGDQRAIAKDKGK